MSASFEDAARGDRLLHLDVRDDNVLIGPDGAATLVDWPYASVGDPTLDLVLFAPSVVLSGGPDPGHLLARSTVRPDLERVIVLLAAFTGHLLSRSRRPPQPGMAGIRGFQRAQGEVALAWLGRLTGWA